MDYYAEKAKRLYNLYLKGEPCRKVYGTVKKDDKYFVIKNPEGKKYKYQIAGGGVEDNETNQEAILREIYEELNINAKIIRSLGIIRYDSNWKYEDKEFTITNEAEIFLLEFVSFSDKTELGLAGEFTGNNSIEGVVLIDEDEMCNDVYEFAKGGIKIKN